MTKRFVLLDRDGTIIKDKHYLHDPEGVELLPGAVQGLQRMAALGYGLAVLSNQSGVGRGYFTEADVDACNARLSELLGDHGVRIEGYFYCPHAPDQACDCRKPAPGLMRQAAAALGFEPSASIMIGDKAADMGLGRNTGAFTILVRTGKGAEHEARCGESADGVADDLDGAAGIIERLNR